MSEKANAKISLHCNGLSTALILLRHPWSGIARIVLDGVEIAEVDLFEENGAIRWWYPIFLGGEEHIIDVIVTGKKNALSRGSQVWVLGGEVFDIDTTTDVPKFHYSSRNNGNPYPLRFNELINQVHREGLILDCGSGDRSHPDPRVISFEY
ncbi:hypothetical protein [Methanoculleus sp.]|uniref:hypothetical protein n=1 Tax=Methanoculleus sp. TaxID=90427 RepID=UPI001BD52F6D|nr:hypothetical protein [Methanoculleus sp.]